MGMHVGFLCGKEEKEETKREGCRLKTKRLFYEKRLEEAHFLMLSVPHITLVLVIFAALLRSFLPKG